MHPILKFFASASGNLWEKLLHWYQNSVIRELLDHLNNNVFNLEFGVYDNFTVSGSANGTVRNVIIGLLFGMIISAILSFYTRNVHGRFIRELLKQDALSPEKAMTLKECGVFACPAVRDQLRRGGALAKLTRCAEQEALEETERKNYQPNLSTDRFYIPEDLKYRAELRFENKGFGKLPMLLTVVVSILGAYLLCRVLPILLTFADWLMTVLAP
ncbi:MAG: hypothetical protein E7620_03805 [Ruminococcaceae bacterium]|nr:hypothetical protein [Oscillospiraceae bacterium]